MVNFPPGGGFLTLNLASRGGVTSTIAAPTNLTASAVAKNKKTATVTLNWTENAAIETGLLIQRVVNATVAGDVTAFSQTEACGTTFYYWVLAFNDTTQSDWSNTASITTPEASQSREGKGLLPSPHANPNNHRFIHSSATPTRALDHPKVPFVYPLSSHRAGQM